MTDVVCKQKKKTLSPGVLLWFGILDVTFVSGFCDPTASLSVLKFLEVMNRCCSSDDFICRSFTLKNETDFTSILSQYLCKMADLITKSGDIWVHQLPPQTVRNPDLLCGFWPDSVNHVAKSSSLIPKVAVHVMDLGRHECYHECSISTHQYPPQSVRITLEFWPLVQFLTRHCQSSY